MKYNFKYIILINNFINKQQISFHQNLLCVIFFPFFFQMPITVNCSHFVTNNIHIIMCFTQKHSLFVVLFHSHYSVTPTSYSGVHPCSLKPYTAICYSAACAQFHTALKELSLEPKLEFHQYLGWEKLFGLWVYGCLRWIWQKHTCCEACGTFERPCVICEHHKILPLGAVSCSRDPQRCH